MTDHVRRDDTDEQEGHATTGGSAVAGAATGAAVGAVGAGPVGAAIGAVGGAAVGAASERAMHAGDDNKVDTHEHRWADTGSCTYAGCTTVRP